MKRSSKRAIATFIAIIISLGSMNMVRANELSEAEARLDQLRQSFESDVQLLNVTLRGYELEAALCVQKYVSETDPYLVSLRNGCQLALERTQADIFNVTRRAANLSNEINALRARIDQLKSAPTPTPTPTPTTEAPVNTEQRLPVQSNQNSATSQQNSGNSAQNSNPSTNVSPPAPVAVSPSPVASLTPAPTLTPVATPSPSITSSPQPTLPSNRITPTPSPTSSLTPGAKTGKTPSPTFSNRKNGKVVTKTITCVSGKNVRKVKAVKPVCPRGFKQKVS